MRTLLGMGLFSFHPTFLLFSWDGTPTVTWHPSSLPPSLCPLFSQLFPPPNQISSHFLLLRFFRGETVLPNGPTIKIPNGEIGEETTCGIKLCLRQALSNARRGSDCVDSDTH